MQNIFDPPHRGQQADNAGITEDRRRLVVDVAVVADDLSGAVETAATFLSRTSRISVVLDTARPPAPDEVDVVAFDTNSRHLDGRAAGQQTAAVVVAVGGSPVVFKKIDSLLRGNVQAELLAVRGVRPHLVIAPALPAAGRIVRNGILHVDGQPLHRSEAWHAEAEPPPDSVTNALSPMTTRVLSLPVVRSVGFGAAIRESLGQRIVPICDAETDADLDRAVVATAGIDQLVLVGSAGLAAALARSLSSQPHTGKFPPSAERVLVCIGSAAHVVAGQLAALRELDLDVVLAQPAELVGDNSQDSARIEAEIRRSTRSVVVVAVDPDAAVDPARSREVARGFSSAVAGAARTFGGLLLTGGETARAVLDQLGITQLRPLFQVHHGAVVCATPEGQLVATRPGSFGDRYSLLSIVRALQSGAPPTEEST